MSFVSQIFFIWSPNLPLCNNSVRLCRFLNFMFPSFFNLFVSKSTCSSGLSAFTQFCLASSLIGNSCSSLYSLYGDLDKNASCSQGQSVLLIVAFNKYLFYNSLNLSLSRWTLLVALILVQITESLKGMGTFQIREHLALDSQFYHLRALAFNTWFLEGRRGKNKKEIPPRKIMREAEEEKNRHLALPPPISLKPY